MEAMTIQGLKSKGILKVGKIYRCVEANTNMFDPGYLYEAVYDEDDDLGLECAAGCVITTTTSLFEPFSDCGCFKEESLAEPASSSAEDNVTSDEPDLIDRAHHYAQFPVEPITMIMQNGFEFWRGSIIKYASRAGWKLYDGMDVIQSEITDLQKIQRFAQMRINQLKGEETL